MPLVLEDQLMLDVTDAAVGGDPSATGDTILDIERFVVSKNPATTHEQTIEWSLDGLSWSPSNLVSAAPDTLCSAPPFLQLQVRQRDLIGNYNPTTVVVILSGQTSCPP